jgi:hypothetical protein
MALFVEVTSVEKNCPIIVNLDHIVEIAPLTAGGCMLYWDNDSGMANARPSVQVKEGFDQFKQFAMQTVTADDIARRFPKVSASPQEAVTPAPKTKKAAPVEIPKL